MLGTEALPSGYTSESRTGGADEPLEDSMGDLRATLWLTGAIVTAFAVVAYVISLKLG